MKPAGNADKRMLWTLSFSDKDPGLQPLRRYEWARWCGEG
jgi:hypothetical protein